MNDDWFDLLSALADADVRYLVVGAHAMAVHGVPRGTQDLDVWIDPEPANVARAWTALGAFGAPLEAIGVSVADLEREGTVIQIGVAPNRIDILTSISGIPAFAEAWAGRMESRVRGRTFPFLGRQALIANKRETGRLKDLGDLEALGES